jgi:hypothetical protein
MMLFFEMVAAEGVKKYRKISFYLRNRMQAKRSLRKTRLSSTPLRRSRPAVMKIRLFKPRHQSFIVYIF